MTSTQILQALVRPSELAALVDFQLLGGKNKIFPKPDMSEQSPAMTICYKFLDQTSRSFAAVIKALDPALRNGICIFYLVLRGLDTVEDDMSIPLDVKLPLLTSFHEKLTTRGWNFHGNSPTEKDRQLLVQFDVVISQFLLLSDRMQQIIADITRRMGAGMAEFASKDLKDVVSKRDYDQYCHYVAGLVGIGLSELFVASGLEEAVVGEDTDLANSMGLFLQKTNIIRDFLEDWQDGRSWWPKDVWANYTDSLESFTLKANLPAAVKCLNHLISDALEHVPDVFKYMSRIKNQTVFNFCAIPQVMAIATLAALHNNPAVFSGVVKIRKGQAVQLMMRATTMASLYTIFEGFLDQIQANLTSTDPSAPRTRAAIKSARAVIAGARISGIIPPPQGSIWLASVGALAVGFTAGYVLRSRGSVALLHPLDQAASAITKALSSSVAASAIQL